MINRAGFTGRPDNPLGHTARATGEEDEDSLVAYLESSTEIYSVMGAERDVVTGDTWIPGAGSLVTDGPGSDRPSRRTTSAGTTSGCPPKQLGAAGLSVVHPLTDALFGSRQTSDGGRAPLLGGPDVLADSLSDDRYHEVEFQCWMGYDRPVTARVRRLAPSVQRITVQIADVPESEREEVVAVPVRVLDRCGFLASTEG
ncbi:hypothetical protein [Streptomyces sp. NPDC096032]|uniref:hypothetical protein n=1 Tax=Streptomyces sp. NPDC096032 TaxID=3366070 RepID=UPI0038281245